MRGARNVVQAQVVTFKLVRACTCALVLVDCCPRVHYRLAVNFALYPVFVQHVERHAVDLLAVG